MIPQSHVNFAWHLYQCVMGRSHQQRRSESEAMAGLLPCSPGKLIESA